MISERNKALTIDVLNGGTLRIIGEKYDICLERVRQITAKTCRQADSELYDQMPKRATTDIKWLRNRKENFIKRIKDS